MAYDRKFPGVGGCQLILAVTALFVDCRTRSIGLVRVG